MVWTLTAAFDGDTQDVVPPPKSKLLKTDKTYALGRKEAPICLNLKKISRNHGTFAVGKFTVDEVGDPDSRPSLEYANTSKKNVIVQRGEEIHPINPGETFALADGDLASVASHTVIKVEWQPVCCYQQASRGKSKSNTSLASCAALGIHLVHMPGQNITHHLTDTYAATKLHALSLVSATAFVKPQWLDEIFRLSNLPLNSNPSTGISLEQTFDLPPIAKYRPTFSPALPSEQTTFKMWEPNEERMNMFSSYRFIFVGEAKHQVDSELRELITRARGMVDVFNVADGATKLRAAIVRAKAKKNQILVLVADQEACRAAVGKDSWKESVEQAHLFGREFFTAQDVIQAVLNADASVFKPSDIPGDDAPASSPLPSVVPNTHPEEGSLNPEPEESEPEPEAPPPRKLPRRVSSRQASQEPKPAEEAPAPPRRQLTRRAQPTGLPIITGLDDPSILLNNMPDTSAVVQPPVQVDPSKPRSRLKRRVGVSAPAENVETLISNAIMSGVEPETGEEPPLKKFKALFEASDPRRSGAESFVQESGAFDEDDLMLLASVGSQTQSQTQGGSKRLTRSGNSAPELLAVPEEEEEESQIPVDFNLADVGKKRKQRGFDGDDVEMAGVEEALNGASGSSSGNGPAAKKRAVQSNAVERASSQPPSVVQQPAKSTTVPAKSTTVPAKSATGGKKAAAAAAGAAPGKPDTDSVFLKAIASTKRGKKTEDDFDRDFNKLKISKSDLRGDDAEPRPEWELLDTFGDETNLRGNFMVIHDLEVFKTDNGPRKRAVGTDPRWDGKPDFKKFKKHNNTAAAKRKIDLFISEEHDSGLGPAYWKGGSSPTRSEEDFGPTQKHQRQPARATEAPTKASRSKAKTQPVIIDDSEDEVEIAPRGKAKRSKPLSKAEPPTKRATRGASKVPDTPAALFLDDPDSDVKMDDGEPGGGTLDEDDFDAGQTLQSSADITAPARRSSRMPAATKKKAAPIIVDDDSDDGAVFTGFGKKKSRR